MSNYLINNTINRLKKTGRYLVAEVIETRIKDGDDVSGIIAIWITILDNLSSLNELADAVGI